MRALFRRVPFVPQLSTTECGAACLAMVMAFHGHAGALARLRTLCGGTRGTSVKLLLRAAQTMGLSARALKAPFERLTRLRLPLLIHWQLNHFVVLERIGERHATIVDPAIGRLRMRLDEFANAYTGVALELWPSSSFLPAKPRVAYRSYFRELAAFRSRLWVVIGAMLGMEVMSLATPAVNQLLVDQVLVPQRYSWVVVIFAALAVADVGKLTLQAIRDRVAQRLLFGMQATLNSSFLRKLLSLRMVYFQQRSLGDLMERVDASAQVGSALAAVTHACFDLFWLLGCSAMMLAYNLQLGALALALAIGRMLFVVALQRQLRERAASVMALRGEERGLRVEAIANAELLSTFRGVDALSRTYGNRLSRRLAAEYGLLQVQENAGSGVALLDAVVLGAILYVGGTSAIRGEISLGVFTAFMMLQDLIRPTLESLFGSIAQASQAWGTLPRIEDVTGAASERVGGQKLRLRGHIEFEHVSFRHAETEPWVLDNVSFTVNAGERVGLVGPSGAGKSTLLQLLLGLIEPTQGRILVDGVSLEQLDLASYRAQLGVVLQDHLTPAGALDRVIAAKAEQPDRDYVARAVRLARLEGVVAKLGAGYAEPLATGAPNLSGGERQRLALASAIYGEPALLILDEATSSLDVDTESRVLANIGDLNATQILVAHRSAALRYVQRLLALQAGKLVTDTPVVSGQASSLRWHSAVLRPTEGMA